MRINWRRAPHYGTGKECKSPLGVCRWPECQAPPLNLRPIVHFDDDHEECDRRLREALADLTARLTTLEGASMSEPKPDETCPNGCQRFGDWWVPEDCPQHLGGVA